MSRYFLGVDIGNSKSHALIADERGQALGCGVAGPGSWESLGQDGARAVLQQITARAVASAGIRMEQVCGAGYGFAGYDWPEDRELHLENIEATGITAPYAFGNDTLVGLIAGAEAGWGVVVVAGTSNNCRGRDRSGREGRVTGDGPRMGEYGGAQEIVARAIQSIALEWTERAPATQLTEAFVREAGARDVEDLLAGLIRGRHWAGADLAPIVFEVAATGDAVAGEIVRWAGRELGSLANGVIRQLSLQSLRFDVVLAGSLYKGSPLLSETMATTIHAVAPRARLVRLKEDPVIGGVLLGMEQVGLKGREIRSRLAETATKLLASEELS